MKHGGRIREAARNYNIPLDQWVDLSTGISPWAWPVPQVPDRVWRCLPEEGDGLEAIAARFFTCPIDSVLALPGSQYAIERLPTIVSKGPVAIPLTGYGEHRLAWAQAGHEIIEYADGEELFSLVQSAKVIHAVVINPNNPTAELLSVELLLTIREALSQRGGYLLVDEAFSDVCSAASLAPFCHLPGLLILRSLGKFFGLAGVRLGFLLSASETHRRLALTMSPWQVSHPARWVGAGALADQAWQKMQTDRLLSTSRRWLTLLTALMPQLVFRSTALFASARGDAEYCCAIFEALASRGVLVRLFQEEQGVAILRFGLPLEVQWELLEKHIRDVVQEIACDTSR